MLSTTPYWPQQNGEVERQNRSILKRLIISGCLNRNWHADLQNCLMMYRATPHSKTGKTPSELMFGQTIREKLPAFTEEKGNETHKAVADRDEAMKRRGKAYANRNRKAEHREFGENELVLVKKQIKENKLSPNFEPGIYKVISSNGSEVVVEATGSGKRFRRSVAHIKKIPADWNPMMASEEDNLLSSLSGEAAHGVQEPEAAVRRSARQGKAPAMLRDFICK